MVTGDGDRPEGAPPELLVIVSAGDAGLRVDQLVARHAGKGRRGAAALLSRALVRLSGRVAKKADRVREGDHLEIALDEQGPIVAEPEAPLDLRWLTEDVIVVAKPAGQPTAPLRPGERGTLASALLGRFPELVGIGYSLREPGLLHRLDTQTSGLVVAARHPAAFETLQRALAGERLEKRYLAIVAAATADEEGAIDVPLAPDPRDARRVTAAGPAGRGARQTVTRYRRTRVAGEFALLEITVHRAYRHQIRAHLALRGMPIVGDAVYGGSRVAALGSRHALHASYVAWAGDAGVPAFAVACPLPPDLAVLFPA